VSDNPKVLSPARVNFGISLSLWDYIFKTNYIPEESGQIDLGFEGIDKFSTSFIQQNLYGFGKSKDTDQS